MKLLPLMLFTAVIATVVFAAIKQKTLTEAPEINAAAWFNAGDGSVSLESLKGKIAVVEFWATWCPPCRKSVPHLNKLHEKYRDKDVVIIGLSNESKATVEKFVQANNMEYIVGAGSTAGKDYGVRGIPHAFVIGPDGTVLWKGHPMNGLDEALADAVKKLPSE